MWIELDEAIQIYAKALRARQGRLARKSVLRTIQDLRAKGDEEGVQVWEKLAAELNSSESARDNPRATATMPAQAAEHARIRRQNQTDSAPARA
jgi:hypothetical protein